MQTFKYQSSLWSICFSQPQHIFIHFQFSNFPTLTPQIQSQWLPLIQKIVHWSDKKPTVEHFYFLNCLHCYSYKSITAKQGPSSFHTITTFSWRIVTTMLLPSSISFWILADMSLYSIWNHTTLNLPVFNIWNVFVFSNNCLITFHCIKHVGGVIVLSH